MKERLVTCNEEDTDGRARVTRDEERVLRMLSRFCRCFRTIRSYACLILIQLQCRSRSRAPSAEADSIDTINDKTRLKPVLIELTAYRSSY